MVVIVRHALHDVIPTPMATIAMMIKIFLITFDIFGCSVLIILTHRMGFKEHSAFWAN